MILRPGYLAVAQKIQEAATAMNHGDIESRLRDSLSDCFRGTGEWAYVVAIFGDDQSGDFVYSCGDGDLKKAPYTMSTSGCTVDLAAAKDVLPLTTYVEEPMELGEAGARHNKSDNAMIQTVHDHAVSLGAACSAKESAGAVQSGLKLVESAVTIEPIALREARADYEIKLIAPGKGSSAFYPAEVLKRDGPRVFSAGTHVYLNHPTAAEESARPEGDVANLAGVLTTTAEYHESHPKGPGLYARMKVFADHASTVEEKAPFVGMSIRAAGNAESGKKQDGLPVLKELTSAESVDVVTRAGAGGMILTEAAKPAPTKQEGSMDAAEIKRLVEAETAPLRERLIRADAREQGALLLEGVSLPAAAKIRVIETVMAQPLPRTESGELDKTKFSEAIGSTAQSEGRYIAGIMGSGRVHGMGVVPVEQDPVKLAESRKREQADEETQLLERENVFGRLMGDKAAAKAAARKGEAA